MGNGVCAVIVTYNRQEKLRVCLEHLGRLSEGPERVLIVDNASSDGTPEMVRSAYPGYDLLVLEHNLGGSGGFEAGMRRAYASGYEYVWLFDDDAYADPDCLRLLLAETDNADVVVPVQIDQTGRRYGCFRWDNGFATVPLEGESAIPVDIFAFVGPLISRRVIERVGFPRVDFFISADDTEYALRIKGAGLRVVCARSAVFFHDYGGQTLRVRRFGRESLRSTQPSWKNYYNVRNEILMVRGMNSSPRQKASVWLYLVKKFGRTSLGEAMYDPKFAERWKYTLLGVRDGLLGRSGKRVAPVAAGGRS